MPKMPVQPSPMASPKSFLWTRRVILTLLLLFVLTPVYVMLSSSLKKLQDVQGSFRWIPSGITFRPYIDIWKTVPLAHYFMNSLIVSVSATLLSVAVAIFAAYGVSRYRFMRPPVLHRHGAVHPDVPRHPLPAAAVPDLREHREHHRHPAVRQCGWV